MEEKLNMITSQLISEIFLNEKIYEAGYLEEGDDSIILRLLDVIASLHNELYNAVIGNYYDYMFHWTNKVGYNGIEDNLFKEVNNDKIN